MYQKIADEIQDKFYEQNFPNDGQRFVAWYLRNIHLRDMNETKDDMTDGADDKQIDAIFIDDNQQSIFILQGKFIGNGSVDAEPLREVLFSWIQLRDLVRLQEVGNSKLKRKLSEVARALEDEYEIKFELITTGELTDAAKADLGTFQAQLVDLSENNDFFATIKVVDNNELKRRYDIALEKDNPTINHNVDLSNSKAMEIEIAGNRVVVATGRIPIV